MCMCVYVSMPACEYMCVWVASKYAEDTGRHQVSSSVVLYLLPSDRFSLNWKLALLARLSDQEVVRIHLSPLPSAGFQASTVIHAWLFLGGCLGLELKSSYFHSKHFLLANLSPKPHFFSFLFFLFVVFVLFLERAFLCIAMAILELPL